ncbi:hypothetical protein NDU88_000793 [Pleurodeles waltl]|uniref:Uncharacterized protein n=1 Tax=Pleurodeles waltl TaxID=8319 RepID=A0AAV7Q1T7_PLEWA|nr:hypothetical protein NDU88_000793 [Pleurodeles waltl]
MFTCGAAWVKHCCESQKIARSNIAHTAENCEKEPLGHARRDDSAFHPYKANTICCSDFGDTNGYRES